MNVVIVYESLFGCTREVAEAIAAGVSGGDESAEVSLVRVSDATAESGRDADLLVVGGPTHMHGVSTGMSRRMGVSGERKAAEKKGEELETEPGAEGPGIRDWFGELPKAAAGRRAAAFDTRADFKLAGGAAHGIARRLRHHGYTLVAEPEGFIILDTEGPLRDGEEERARAWGAALVREPVPEMR
jgi:flavodoxin